MNEHFEAFVVSGQTLAAQRGLRWELDHDELGAVAKHSVWDITNLVRMTTGPKVCVSDVGFDREGLAHLNQLRASSGRSPLPCACMSRHWIDFYLSAMLYQVLVLHNKPATARTTTRWIKLLAAAAEGVDPWEVSGEHVQDAFNAALRIGSSGQSAVTMRGLIANVIDNGHLADQMNLARFCLPFRTTEDDAATNNFKKNKDRANSHYNIKVVSRRLTDRAGAEKLPGHKAFWELVRIVFTETPRSYSDAIRFEVIKVGILTGLRVGELVSIPADWKVTHEYFDHRGRPAGERGGYSTSLALRNFAEKQSASQDARGVVLVEARQDIPKIFEAALVESLEHVVALTAPLRERLKRQTASGRWLPEFGLGELIPAHDAFVRLSGSIVISDEPPPDELVERYRQKHDFAVLEEIRDLQFNTLAEKKLTPIIKYFARAESNAGLLRRDASGNKLKRGSRMQDGYYLVSDLEKYIALEMPSKLSDVEAAQLSDGSDHFGFDSLFLMPVRALIETRNDGVLDPTRYFAIGRISVADVQNMMGMRAEHSLFARYGENEACRGYSIDPHALRHLLNTELFRVGLADTAISLRFNRQSLAQSRAYDHRSHSERLDDIDLPPIASELLSPNAQAVARMIQSNGVSGPIVDEFLRLQIELGDDEAFAYLEAEADGFHVTPYGYCINSFTVDPCPNQLECFRNCRHLARTGNPRERQALEALRDRIETAVQKILSRPESARTLGWQNQLKQAQQRLAAVEIILATTPGERAFPEGEDRYVNPNRALGETIIDHALRRAT